MNIKMYYIDTNYVNFLRQFDSKIPYNKNSTRPYIGIVYTYNGINYFAPLSSPKEKHLKFSNNAIDIFKIDDGKLGIVNINNMIPTPLKCLKEVLPTVTDVAYRNLIQDQLTYINKKKKVLLSKVKQFQLRYRNQTLNDRILARTCNFPLLEEKYREYKIK